MEILSRTYFHSVSFNSWDSLGFGPLEVSGLSANFFHRRRSRRRPGRTLRSLSGPSHSAPSTFVLRFRKGLCVSSRTQYSVATVHEAILVLSLVGHQYAFVIKVFIRYHKVWLFFRLNEGLQMAHDVASPSSGHATLLRP